VGQQENVSIRPRPRRGATVAGRAPDPAVARWIRRALAADPPRAKSLLMTVWGDALAPHGGTVWLSGLIRLMAPFGLSERLVRTAVFRLARDGWVAAETRGRRSRYGLTAEGARRIAQAHRRIYDPAPDDWDDEWEIVLAPATAGGSAARRKLRDELSWDGFGTLAPGVYARPVRDASAVAQIASALGIGNRISVLRARDDAAFPGARLASRVDAAWDLRARAADYRRFLARFGTVIETFRAAGATADPAQCFVARTLLIHAFRRALLRDPRLPPALLPLDWPGNAAFALCRDFYRLTHRRAEAHLAATLAGDGEDLPPATEAFYARFGGLGSR
jgi:phenylacetic acid degradation operon negative regulatory protein